MLKHLIPALLLAAVISSCTDDTPSGPPSDSFVRAKAGSSFTYEEYATDSTNAMVAGSRDTTVSTFLQTSATVGGKSGVVVVEDVSRSGRDTTYFAYESNNNVSILATDESGAAQWLTFPVGTGTTITNSSSDTTVEQGMQYVIGQTMTMTAAGNENITANGRTIATKKIRMSYRVTITVDGELMLDLPAEYVYFYAPSLGFFVRGTSQARRDMTGDWVDGSYRSLISSDLK